MKCRNLLVMIAAVAAWSIASGASAGATASSKAKTRDAAAWVRVLIQRNSKNTQIVTFDDHRFAAGQDRSRLAKACLGTRYAGQHHPGQLSRQHDGPGAHPARRKQPSCPGPSPRVVRRRCKATDSGTTETISFGLPRELPVTVLRGSRVSWTGNARYAASTRAVFGLFPAAAGSDLDRVAFAVDKARSSHGLDPGM